MSVNCVVQLPADVCVDDVALVIGLAAGLPATKNEVSSWFYTKAGGRLEVKGCESAPALAEISFGPWEPGATLVDGEVSHSVRYHFESPSGGRSLSPPSTAFWCAVAKRLVDFFGGQVDYNDSDAECVDHKARRPRRGNNPIDGRPYDDFQKALYAVKVLSAEELAAGQSVAAYQPEE